MGLGGEEEVQAIRSLLHGAGVLVGLVLQDDLLEVEEGLLVVHLLPDLDHGLPRVLGLHAAAVVTHLVCHDVLHHKGLLEDGGGKHLLLNRQLDLDPLGVGLGPDEAGINQPDLGKALEPLEAEGEQLLGLEGAHHPLGRGLHVPLTELAPVNGGLLRDSLSDIHLILDAVHAHVGRVGRDRHTTVAAQAANKKKMKENWN